MAMSYIVALTGGIGCGKSAVSELFAKHNVPIVDADIIARQVVAPGTDALSAIGQQFGEQIILANGQLDRRQLRQRIFQNAADKAWLEQLLHPLIRQETERQFKAAVAPYLIWSVPLLLENQLQHQANSILLVDVAPEIQLQRTMQRDGISREQAQAIIASQVSRAQRLQHATEVIDNNGNFSSLVQQVTKLHQYYLQIASDN